MKPTSDNITSTLHFNTFYGTALFHLLTYFTEQDSGSYAMLEAIAEELGCKVNEVHDAFEEIQLSLDEQLTVSDL